MRILRVANFLRVLRHGLFTATSLVECPSVLKCPRSQPVCVTACCFGGLLTGSVANPPLFVALALIKTFPLFQHVYFNISNTGNYLFLASTYTVQQDHMLQL